MSQIFSYNFDNDIKLRSDSLTTNELLVKDPISGEYKPIVPGQGGGEAEVPYYVDTSEINFGDKRVKINPSHLEVGVIGSTMRKTEVNGFGLDVTDDVGNNAKIEGGAIIYKKGSLEGEEENPTVTMDYDDIAEVVDKIKPIEYLEDTEIVFQPVNNVYSRIKNNSVKIGTGTNTNSGVNNISLAYEGLYVNGSSGNTTVYRNGEIRRVLSSVTKTLNIGNIADSQTNYLKPDKIEFANGSGMSEGTLYYRDDESALQSVSIKDLAEAGSVLPDYIKGSSIQFNDDGDPGFSRIEQDVIGTNTFSAEDFGGTSTLYGPTEILRRESGVNKTTNVNDVIDVTNKFIDVTAPVGTINGIHSKFGGAGANPAFDSTNIQTSLLKIMAITANAADINTVTNNLKDLTSTAAQIDDAVANSGGGATHYYLEDNSIEIDTDTNAATSFRSIGPSTHTQITSKEFRAYKTATNNYAFNNTTVDGNGMVIKGNTSDSFTEYGNNDIWVSTGTQSYNASVQDIITSTNKIKNISANDINNAISADQVNIVKVRDVSPTDTLALHTVYLDAVDGIPNVDTLTIPDEPGTYILSFVGNWGDTSAWGIKKFYLYGPINKLMTINARFRGTGYDYVMVSPIMRDSLPKNGFMMYQFNVQNMDPSPVGDITDGLEIIFTVSNHSVGTDPW